MLEVKWKVLKNLGGEVMTAGFNPCYVGSKMESSLKELHAVTYFLFQSLLCWK